MACDCVSRSDLESSSSFILERSGEAKRQEDDSEKDGDKALLSMSPGYRFRPLDNELVDFYLRKKFLNEPLPWNRIYDVDLYQHSPEYFTSKYKPWGDKEWYFFTPRYRKYRNGKRPNRAAGGVGYWKATDADKQIMSSQAMEGEKPIGSRKTLVFHEGKPKKGIKTNWIMHEYRINGLTRTRTEDNMRLDDCVLCRIYYNKTSRSSKAEKIPMKRKTLNRVVSPNNDSLESINGKKNQRQQTISGAVSIVPDLDQPSFMPINLEHCLNPNPINLNYELYNNTMELHSRFSRFDFPLLSAPANNENYCSTDVADNGTVSPYSNTDPGLQVFGDSINPSGQINQAYSGSIDFSYPTYSFQEDKSSL